MQYIPPSLPPVQNDVPPTVNPPLLSFRVDDIKDSKILHNYVGVDDMPPCSNVKKDVIRKGINHALQNLFLPHFPSMKKDVINDTPSQ